MNIFLVAGPFSREKGKVVEICLKYLKTLKSQYGPLGANNVRGWRDFSGQKESKEKNDNPRTDFRINAEVIAKMCTSKIETKIVLI